MPTSDREDRGTACMFLASYFIEARYRVVLRLLTGRLFCRGGWRAFGCHWCACAQALDQFVE